MLCVRCQEFDNHNTTREILNIAIAIILTAALWKNRQRVLVFYQGFNCKHGYHVKTMTYHDGAVNYSFNVE